eukprot:12355439-Karenia_brevis.AAC.1
MSESSEFEAHESKLRQMGLHGSAKVIELRNRYWQARREQKQSAKQKPSGSVGPYSESSTSATSNTLPTKLPYALE